MQLESRIHDHRHPNGILNQAVSTAQGVARAAKSIAKTQVLRHDRVTPDALETRLSVCRDCPGGHATFKKSSGELHTCGPMLESLRQAGEKTCGCVLKLKAVDAKEDCPFGYWPTLESKQIVRGEEPQAMPATAAAAQRSVPGLITADKTLAIPRHGRSTRSSCRKRREGGVQAYSESQMRALVRRREAGRKARPFDPGRRKFIGSAAAAGAGALVFAPKVWADGPTKYLTVSTSCGTSGSYTHVPYYEGWKDGDIVKAGDDNCYEVTGCESLASPPSGLASSASSATCADCSEPVTCGGCDFCELSDVEMNSFPQIDYSSSTGMGTVAGPINNAMDLVGGWTLNTFSCSFEKTSATFEYEHWPGDVRSHRLMYDHYPRGGTDVEAVCRIQQWNEGPQTWSDWLEHLWDAETFANQSCYEFSNSTNIWNDGYDGMTIAAGSKCEGEIVNTNC